MNTIVKNDSIITTLDNEIIEVCVPTGETLYSRGIWFGDNPLNFVLPIFMLQIIASFVISRTIYFLLRPFRQPQSVCNILGGVILGPSVMGRNQAYIDTLFSPKELSVFHTIGVLGGYSFIFIACVKMDFAMILRSSRSVWGIALLSILFPLAVNTTLCILFQGKIPGLAGGPFLIVIAGGLSETYFPVIAYALSELNLLTSELGQLALSCAMINELIFWLLLPVAATIGVKNASYIYRPILGIFGLVFFAVFILRPPILWLVKNTPEGKPVKQMVVVSMWLGAFLMGVACQAAGGQFAAGIMVVGLIIPDGPPLGSAIVERFELLTTEIFLPLFYLHIGYNVDFSMVKSMKVFSLWHLIVFLGFLGKMAGCCFGSICFGIRFENSLLLGLILNMRGFMEMLTFNNWRTRKWINEASFSLLVITNVVVAAFVTPLAEIFYKPYLRLDLSASINQRVRSLQTTSRNEELRILTCIHKEEYVSSWITLFEALNPKKESPICIYMVHLVELIGSAAPVLIPYKAQNKRIMPASSNRIMRVCKSYEESSSGPVVIQFSTLIAPYGSMHQSICRLAQDRFVPLIIVPFHKTQQFDAYSGPVRTFNINIQDFASCTVGILVDKSLRCRQLSAFRLQLAILFLGGPDDREGLAFCTRMSAHPEVSITLVRIDFVEYTKEENRNDRMLDEAMLKEFRIANGDNPRAFYRELYAEDALQVTNCVRSTGSEFEEFDLVVVGKRRGYHVKFEENMVEWLEYPELGVIADVFASPDCHGGLLPVLVMQHSGDLCPTNYADSKLFHSMA